MAMGFSLFITAFSFAVVSPFFFNLNIMHLIPSFERPKKPIATFVSFFNYCIISVLVNPYPVIVDESFQFICISTVSIVSFISSDLATLVYELQWDMFTFPLNTNLTFYCFFQLHLHFNSTRTN